MADKDRHSAEMEVTSSHAQAEVASLQYQLKQLTGNLEAARDVSRAPPLTETDEAANVDANLREQLAAAQTQHLQAEKDVTELQRSVSSKDAEIASLKKQLDSAAARADGHYAALQEINQQLQVREGPRQVQQPRRRLLEVGLKGDVLPITIHSL